MLLQQEILQLRKNSRKSYFKDNKGSKGKNTYIGAEWSCTTETVTPLTISTIAKLLGTTTYTNEVYFSHTTDNAFVSSTSLNQQVDIQGSIYLLGGPNDVVDLYVRKWDNSATTYVNLQTIRRTIVSSPTGADTAEYSFFLSTDLDENDRIELWVINTSDSDDVTMINTSKIKINER